MDGSPLTGSERPVTGECVGCTGEPCGMENETLEGLVDLLVSVSLAPVT